MLRKSPAEREYPWIHWHISPPGFRRLRASSKASFVNRLPTPASHGFDGSLAMMSYRRFVSSRWFRPSLMIVSTRGSNVDLIHVLFGTILAVDSPSLLLVAGITSVTLITLAVIYRPLVIECLDPGFFRALGAPGAFYHLSFLVLVVLNLVAGFQALGTLMAVGMMMLPAATARFWAQQLWSLSAVAAGIGMLSGFGGLILSYHLDLPSGPAIILSAGGLYLLSLIIGTRQGLLRRWLPERHLAG